MITMKKKILLHSCCGPCSTAVIERLLTEYDVTVFYYNPNIYPVEEYEYRKDEQKRFISEYNKKNSEKITFVEGDYDNENYYAAVKGLENENEGGARCVECFRLRLEKSALFAADNGFEIFDTTLSVSPHKNYDLISKIGREMEDKYGVKYLAGNYKKQDGFKRSTELAREYELYRQNYCGCEFSIWWK